MLWSLLVSVNAESANMCFASCVRLSYPEQRQPWWDVLADMKPDAFMWLGDAVYADKLNLGSRVGLSSKVPDPPDFHQFYRGQKEHPEYARFANQTRILGTWDDHDYGINDGDRTWPYKDASQKAFLDFLDVPEDSPRRSRKGVYSSERIPFGDSHILVLLLDGRYHMDAVTTENGDILGAEQWEWLENEVKNSDAKVILLGSGIQILWSDWGKVAEHWNNFAGAKKRLLSLLSGRRVIFLSGDVHMFEVRHVSPWNALEVTSSGLSHAWGDGAMNRIVELVGNEVPNFIATVAMTMGQRYLPHRFQVFNSLQKNFACLNISAEGVNVGAWDPYGAELFQRHFANAEFELKFNPEDPINSSGGAFEHLSDCWLFLLLVFLMTTLPLVCCCATCFYGGSHWIAAIRRRRSAISKKTR